MPLWDFASQCSHFLLDLWGRRGRGLVLVLVLLLKATNQITFIIITINIIINTIFIIYIIITIITIIIFTIHGHMTHLQFCVRLRLVASLAAASAPDDITLSQGGETDDITQSGDLSVDDITA